MNGDNGFSRGSAGSLSRHNSFAGMFRLKHSDSHTMNVSSMPKCLSFWQLIPIGVGATIGAGVYVLIGTAARERTGPALPWAFLIAAIASGLAAFCYAELASRCPSAGSAYHYAYTTVGEVVAWLIGWALILEYTVGGAAVARGISPNLAVIFGGTSNLPSFLSRFPLPFTPIILDPCAAITVLLVTALLAKGIKESAAFQLVMTAVNVLILTTVVGVGFWIGCAHDWPGYQPSVSYLPFGVNGLLGGAAMVFYSYVGFDSVASTAEEVKNPQRDLPLGIAFCLLLCAFLYMAVSSVLVGIIPYDLIDEDTPMSQAFKVYGVEWAMYLVAIGALAALSTTLLGSLLPQPRILMAMGRDGLLPPWFCQMNSASGVPFNATMITGGMAAIMALVMDIEQLSGMVSIGTLSAFTVVSVAVLILRFVPPAPPPPPSNPFAVSADGGASAVGGAAPVTAAGGGGGEARRASSSLSEALFIPPPSRPSFALGPSSSFVSSYDGSISSSPVVEIVTGEQFHALLMKEREQEASFSFTEAAQGEGVSADKSHQGAGHKGNQTGARDEDALGEKVPGKGGKSKEKEREESLDDLVGEMEGVEEEEEEEGEGEGAALLGEKRGEGEDGDGQLEWGLRSSGTSSTSSSSGAGHGAETTSQQLSAKVATQPQGIQSAASTDMSRTAGKGEDEEARARRRSAAGWAIGWVSAGLPLLAIATLIDSWSIRSALLILGFPMAALGTFRLFFLEEDEGRHSFGSQGGFICPFVPLLPIASMAVNIYLMVNLGVGTWVRCSLWLLIGSLVYVTYGIHHSVLAEAPGPRILDASTRTRSWWVVPGPLNDWMTSEARRRGG